MITETATGITYQITLQVVLNAVAAVLVLATLVLLWQYRDAQGAPPLLVLTSGILLWVTANVGQHAMTTLETKLLFWYPQHLGLALVPISWYAFAMRFTDRDAWVTRRKLTVIAVPLALYVLAAWTNQLHHLAIVDVDVVQQGGVFRLQQELGPIGIGMTLYSFAINMVSTAVLLYGVFGSQQFARVQAVVIIGGITVPWIAGMFFWGGVWNVEPEVFWSITCLAFTYAVVRHRLFDLTPVARQHILDGMRDGIVIIDDRDRIVDYNPKAEQLLGATADLGTGIPISAITDSLSEIGTALTLQESRSGIELTDSAGRERYVDVHVMTLFGDERDEVAILELQDVTEAKRRQVELEAQNERLENVADAIAHDLRNPINVASGFVTMLDPDDEQEAQAKEKIESSLDRMQDIIDDVLVLARQGEVEEREPLDIGQVAESAWSHVDTAEATLNVNGTNTIEGDEGQVTTMLENLFRNAVEHGGDSVTVTVEGLANGDTGFAVGDDGPGIPPEIRDELFDHGVTTNEDGTGFGLSIVNRIANVHGWDVQAEESDSGGARFVVRTDD